MHFLFIDLAKTHGPYHRGYSKNTKL